MVAKKSAAHDYEIDWIQRDRKVIDGLDHLGIELVSVNLYQAMLAGLTNAIGRARYYAFYPWTVHRYAQEGPKSRTKAVWRNWFRALDFTYAVACMAHERELGQDLGSSVVGAELATNLIKNERADAKIDLHGPSSVGETGTVPETGADFKNPEGGFGQYYKGPLRELGVLLEHGSATWPDVQLSNYAGKRIAQTLDGKEPFDELKAIALKGSARLGDLAGIGKTIHPGAIDADSDELAEPLATIRVLLLGAALLCLVVMALHDGSTAEHTEPESDNRMSRVHRKIQGPLQRSLAILAKVAPLSGGTCSAQAPANRLLW